MWLKTAAAIKEIKNQLTVRNESFFLVDIGDHMDRSHLITEGTLGQANVDLLNRLGYNFITIGNNEGITFPKDILDQIYSQANFEVLVNNVYELDGSSPAWASPYKIVSCEGIHIGIIGTTIHFEQLYKLLGWKVEHALEALQRDVSVVRQKADFIVLLSHLGLPQDELITREIEEIDLVLGAHTHQVLYRGKKVNHSWIAQAGRSGRYIGLVSVEWNDTPLEKEFMISAQCIPTEAYRDDPETCQALSEYQVKAGRLLSEPIIQLEQDLNIDWYNESILGNLLAESLSDWCNTDIALVNAGQILDGLSAGKITKQDLHQICPHPINPCIVTVTGAQLFSIIERFLDPLFQQEEIKGFGFRGKVLGMLCIAGLEMTVEKINGQQILKLIDVSYKGSSLVPEQKYQVVTIDMFTFSRMFPEFYNIDKNTIQYYVPEFLRDLLAFRLQQGRLDRAKVKRMYMLGNLE